MMEAAPIRGYRTVIAGTDDPDAVQVFPFHPEIQSRTEQILSADVKTVSTVSYPL
jgi:hypothetical protein